MKMSMEYPCIYFEKDGKCRKFSDNTAVSYCVMGPCPEQKSSNADRIRAMSDEELASFLCDFLTSCEPEHPCNDCVAKSYCHTGHNGMIDWLQQPAEEESNAD